MRTEQRDTREQIEAIHQIAKVTVQHRRGLTGKVNEHDLAAAAAVYRVVVARMVADAEQAAERRGAERGWDGGVQAHTAHLYGVKFGTAAAGGMAPNPYRGDL